jgi:hypothetical protein
MKTTERLVYEYLLSRGYTEIIYEPDGKVPPDFLVEGRIAVEARRLNQNYTASSRLHGLEEDAIPLWKKVEKLALSLGPPMRGRSWFLCCDFCRPIESWNQLAPKIRGALASFLTAETQEKTEIVIGNRFSLELIPASHPHPTFYVMGAQIDGDAGGWVISEIERNLQLCVREKTEKRNRNARRHYPEWWLVLADHIGYGFDDYDQTQFRKQASFVHEWDKIVLLDPLNHTRAFEV